MSENNSTADDDQFMTTGCLECGKCIPYHAQLCGKTRCLNSITINANSQPNTQQSKFTVVGMSSQDDGGGINNVSSIGQREARKPKRRRRSKFARVVVLKVNLRFDLSPLLDRLTKNK